MYICIWLRCFWINHDSRNSIYIHKATTQKNAAEQISISQSVLENFQTETVHNQTTEENEEIHNRVIARGVLRLHCCVYHGYASEKFHD